MQTKFDDITDTAINDALAVVSATDRYPERESHLRRIAYLAYHMNYWKSWLGPPLTYYEFEGLEFDGQHRCRAIKFLARRKKVQIHIPVRYNTLG